MRYAEKMRQADHEAKATVVGLVIVIVAWIALGFGLAGTGIEVFHTPLWVITGTVGTWIVAIAVAVFMSHRVIADVALDDDECAVEPSALSQSDEGDSDIGFDSEHSDIAPDLASAYLSGRCR